MALFSPSVRIPRYDDYVISRRVGLIRLRVGPLNFHYLKGEEIFLDFQRSSKKSLTKYMNALRSVVPTLQMSTCWSCWMKRCLFFQTKPHTVFASNVEGWLDFTRGEVWRWFNGIMLSQCFLR